MANPEEITRFEKNISDLKEWESKKDTLLRRPEEWGSQQPFQASEEDIDHIFKMARSLSTLSVKDMEQNQLHVLNDQFEKTLEVYGRIDNSPLEDLMAAKNNLVSSLESYQNHIREIYKTEAPWLTIYLGNNQWFEEAKEKHEEMLDIREAMDEALKSANEVLAVAKQTAGEAGAVNFSNAFANQACAAKKSSRWWLIWTGAAFGFASMATVLFVALPLLGMSVVPTTPAEAMVYLSWRIGTVGLLVLAAAWCGKHYKALRHNYEVNQHREACLKNMKAFHAASEDESIKDLVVLEFARAATQGMPTGFISSKAEAKSDASSQILSLAARRAPLPGES